MAAERETADRLIAGYLADRVGAEFAARISGVTRSGLFVRLTDTGADGFVPAATIGDDYYRHDEDRARPCRRPHRARPTGWATRCACASSRRSRCAGALRFEMLSPGKRDGGAAAHKTKWSGKRLRGRNRRR